MLTWLGLAQPIGQIYPSCSHRWPHLWKSDWWAPLPGIRQALTNSGYIIYRTGSSSTLHWFLIGSTTFLFLIGAGLASKGVGFFQYYRFAKGVGGDVSETGDGPGSFQVDGNVWHLTYGNPEVSLSHIVFNMIAEACLDRLAHDQRRLAAIQLDLWMEQYRHAGYHPSLRVLLAPHHRHVDLPQVERRPSQLVWIHLESGQGAQSQWTCEWAIIRWIRAR